MQYIVNYFAFRKIDMDSDNDDDEASIISVATTKASNVTEDMKQLLLRRNEKVTYLRTVVDEFEKK